MSHKTRPVKIFITVPDTGQVQWRRPETSTDATRRGACRRAQRRLIGSARSHIADPDGPRRAGRGFCQGALAKKISGSPSSKPFSIPHGVQSRYRSRCCIGAFERLVDVNTRVP
jgi:hypothetical protein